MLQNQQYNEAKVRNTKWRFWGLRPFGLQARCDGRQCLTACAWVLRCALPAQVSQWTSSCLEHCIKRLTALNKPFKYVVTCIIMQKNGESGWAVKRQMQLGSQ